MTAPRNTSPLNSSRHYSTPHVSTRHNTTESRGNHENRNLYIDRNRAVQPVEIHDDSERRVWKAKMHTTEGLDIGPNGEITVKGQVFIQPMSLKQALDSAAKYLGLQVPGRGKSTYTKHFTSGVICAAPIVLNVNAADVQGGWILANADGVRGSGKRVPRCFPDVPKGWRGKA